MAFVSVKEVTPVVLVSNNADKDDECEEDPKDGRSPLNAKVRNPGLGAERNGKHNPF